MPMHDCRIMKNSNIYTDETQTERIADYLIFLLRIPDGHELVPYFSTGFEASNKEALITWINNMCADIDPDEAENRLELLVMNKRGKVMDEEVQ